jgi:hypothetical protein
LGPKKLANGDPRAKRLTLPLRAHTAQQAKCIVLPVSPHRTTWELILMATLLYTAIVTPFEVAFLPVSLDAIFFLNRIVDFVFISDTILTFFTPFRDPNTMFWVVSHRRIAQQYMFDFPFWFWIDAVTCVPYDAIAYAVQTHESSELYTIRLLRLLRLIKLARLARGLPILRRWEIEHGFRYAHITLISDLLMLFFMAHWIACLMALLPFFDNRNTVPLITPPPASPASALPQPDNWITVYFVSELGVVDFDDVNIWSVYLAAYDFAIVTVTTIGYGDILPRTDLERGVVAVIILLGGLMYAYILGSLINIVTNLDPLLTTFKHNVDDTVSFMRDKEMPVSVQRRIRKYMIFALAARRAEHHHELLQTLSPGLLAEVCHEVHRKWLDLVPFAQDMRLSKRAFVYLASLLEFHAFAPLDLILTHNLACGIMYMVSQGQVLVHRHRVAFLGERSVMVGVHILCQLDLATEIRRGLREASSCVGHECVLHSSPALYSATALTYVQCYALSREAIEQCARKFPGLQLTRARAKQGWERLGLRLSARSPLGLQAERAETELRVLKSELFTVLEAIKTCDARLKSATTMAVT